MANKGDKFLAKSIVPNVQDQMVEFVGIQSVGIDDEEYPPFAMYNLTQDIAGHPAQSTVARDTLTDYGFVLPEDAP
jgi:hypothetical protein